MYSAVGDSLSGVARRPLIRRCRRDLQSHGGRHQYHSRDDVAEQHPLKVGSAGGFDAHTANSTQRQAPAWYYADGTAGNRLDRRKRLLATRFQSHVHALQAAMMATGASHGASVSVGDYLEPENGNKVGPTRQGINDLCGGERAARRSRLPRRSGTGNSLPACTDATTSSTSDPSRSPAGIMPNKVGHAGYFTSMATTGEGDQPGHPDLRKDRGLRK